MFSISMEIFRGTIEHLLKYIMELLVSRSVTEIFVFEWSNYKVSCMEKRFKYESISRCEIKSISQPGRTRARRFCYQNRMFHLMIKIQV